MFTFTNRRLACENYLQTSVLPLNRTLSIECCSEISINLVFRSQCYFASIFYSIADVFLYNQFLFSLFHFILCRMYVCHMFNKVLTYFLTYFCFGYIVWTGTAQGTIRTVQTMAHMMAMRTRCLIRRLV